MAWPLRLLLLLWALVALPAGAFAHAALIGTEPADGAVLAQGPAGFTLTFSEPVSPLVLTLVKPDGEAAPLTAFRLAGNTVEITAPPRLAPGSHVLSWRVVSADGHPVGGSLLFSIGAPSAAPMVTQTVDWWLRATIWIARIGLYAGLFLGAGGAFAVNWLAQGGRSGTRFCAAAILYGLIAAPLSLGLLGLDALGAPLAQLTAPVVWQAGFGTTFGRTVLVALAALCLGGLSLALPRAFAKLVSLAGLLGVGAALAASGHASAADPQWLMRPMVFLHGVGVAVWTGALVPLGLALKRQAPEAGGFLRRFSRLILAVVAILAMAGIVLAVVQVQTPSALVETAYGRLLVVKLVLVAVLLGLAAVNRWRLTVPAEAGDQAARKKLARTIGVETLIVLAIFGIAAGWRFTPPPRALAIAAAQPASVHIHTLKAMADLSIEPGHAGPAAAAIVIMTGDFGRLAAREVTLVLSKPESGIEPFKRPARKGDDGIWRVDNLVVPVAGHWTVRLDVLISDFEMTTLSGTIDIRP